MESFSFPGATRDEILISCHACHPSLCNDNLSGVALATCLAKALTSSSHRYSYRFLFIPGTIGSIVWLSRNEPQLHRIKHGLVLACTGDRGNSSYKKSRMALPRLTVQWFTCFSTPDRDTRSGTFSPNGYDEPPVLFSGHHLPVGCFSRRTPHGQFPEYHTSADD